MRAVIDRLLAIDLPIAREIVVVDDGSTDGTKDVLAAVHADGVPIVVMLGDRNGGKGSAVIAECNPCSAAGDVGRRDVRRVSAVAKGNDESRLVHALLAGERQQCVDRDAFPFRIELRPFRDAVDVDVGLLVRECAKLVP